MLKTWENELMYVVGARPNFVKMAPVIDAMSTRAGWNHVVVHTGQHYDRSMSGDVLAQLDFPEPDIELGIGSGTHGEQTARVLVEIERVLVERSPDLVVVAGDVNSTLATALAASKLGIRVAHIEAGLRSFDWTMPEEVNRVLTDRLSDVLFTHSPEALDNLVREGIDESRVYYVGNTMIDSLRRFVGAAEALAAWERYGVQAGEYVLTTLHRPSNVDRPEQLERIVAALCGLARRARVLFPVHPRTRARLDRDGNLAALRAAGVDCIDPLGYLDFLSLELGAGSIVTDSGGIQEEASALGVPCYTLRANTERPITLRLGTNVLLGEDPARIAAVEPGRALLATPEIPLWDGRSGERVADVIESLAGASISSVAAGA